MQGFPHYLIRGFPPVNLQPGQVAVARMSKHLEEPDQTLEQVGQIRDEKTDENIPCAL